MQETKEMQVLIPGWGRSLGGGNGNPLQYSCLENSMGRKWHHWFNRHKLEQTLGDGEGQGSLVCCSPWGYKESERTWQLKKNKTHLFNHQTIHGLMLDFPQTPLGLFLWQVPTGHYWHLYPADQCWHSPGWKEKNEFSLFNLLIWWNHHAYMPIQISKRKMGLWKRGRELLCN